MVSSREELRGKKQKGTEVGRASKFLTLGFSISSPFLKPVCIPALGS